ncbi:hypothetical protein JCM11641_000594 [Rhodosporidiobolus odoratus]
MASFVSTPAVYQPGKPPLLIDASPSGISGFLRSARLYLRQKKIDTDKDKISYLGEGLVGFPELYNWYNASADIHEAETYKAFVADLQRKALPRDSIWEAKGNLRWAKQEGQDYEDWSTAMRTEHLALTEAVMSTKDFVECLLYGMDSELSVVLRNSNVLKNSGSHRDNMTNLAFPTATTVVYAATIDYGAFDIEARNKWAKIASRRLANATQLKLLGKKSSSPSSSSLASNKINNAAKNPSTTSRKPVATTTEGSGTGGRTAKLTELEKDWLSATQGCFKCRQSYVNHSASDCRTWPTPGYVVPVPKGWDRLREVPDVKPSTTTEGKVVTGFRALRVEDSNSEIDLPESLGNGTDTDEEGCVLPPLPLLVGSKRRSRSADALADSDSGLSLISDKLASELGLVRQKLSRPKLYRLAIQGGEEFKTLSEFVRVPLRLENGSWEAGDTVLIVAPLEPPFDIILGTPFLRNHRISISLFPEPAFTIAQPAPLEPIDLFADVEGPATQLEAMEGSDDEKRDEIIGSAVEQLVASVNARTEEEREMAERAARVMKDYDDLFPSVLPALTADYLIKTTTRHRIKFVDESKTHNQRGFNVPQKWREKWKRMLDEHITAGCLRPSTSPFASAAFVIPKKDLEADPRWVNDYRGLNGNTIKDRTPLPIPDEVLADAALAKYWGKIEMTNAFFQTAMAEEDVQKTAIKTPWSLFEWTVMPQGLCNAPATHQARVNEALRHLVGACCQAFVDDVIIYSKTLEEHEQNCRAVLSALRAAGLYCSRKKTDLFSLRTEFLGHIISRDGIEADPSKVDKIKNWIRPKTVTQVRGFLGIVQYLRKFIPQLAEHTAILTPLTRKGLTRIDHLWTEKEERAFGAIKRIVTSLPVLKPVDQDSDEPIWLMTDASKVGVGAVLLQGKDWKTAHPCGFYSQQYIAAEKNYPTHEQELLGVIAALKAWRIDLLGVHFRVLTDHDTLRHFQTQAALSKRQARWTEVLADYDYELSYVPGKMNAVADSMSCFSFSDDVAMAILQNLEASSSFSLQDDLLYFEGTRLVVPDMKAVREVLLHDAHDALGHLGPKKTLASLSASFYWSGMSKSVLVERTNKTVVQMLRQQVARNQKDWVRHLSSTEYGINAAVNDSTGRTPFDLVLGFPPPLLPTPLSPPSSLPAVESILSERSAIIGQARDTLAAAKVRQATQANRKRSPEVEYAVGNMVMVDSSDRRSRYKTKGGDVRAAKLFPRWDGTYQVADASPSTLTYRLSLPDSDRAHPVFHSSKLKRYIANNPTEYASREPPRPEPIDVDGGAEYQVEAIVDEKKKNRTRRFLVKWEGYPGSENTWEPLAHVEDTAALEAWEGRRVRQGEF